MVWYLERQKITHGRVRARLIKIVCQKWEELCPTQFYHSLESLNRFCRHCSRRGHNLGVSFVKDYPDNNPHLCWYDKGMTTFKHLPMACSEAHSYCFKCHNFGHGSNNRQYFEEQDTDTYHQREACWHRYKAKIFYTQHSGFVFHPKL